jgi:MGT family glycosyltransferase
MSFGTVLGHVPEAVQVYRCALDAVGELDARVLLTVGRATDVATLGPVPANTRVEQWVSQETVLRDASVVVCHGGTGTTLGALAAGVPLVICPLFADQPHNARAVKDAGAAVVLAAGAESTGGLRSLGAEDVAPLRESIEKLISEPSYRRAAGRLASEISNLPLLENLVEQLV